MKFDKRKNLIATESKKSFGQRVASELRRNWQL